ncbi:MAG TPA: hypothetical protein DIW64_11235 [Cellvibrio sp.]|nr:hypothetical protein [Cellvibrio sp.]
MKTIIRTIAVSLLMCLCFSVSAAQVFPLPEGYFVKAKMPMHLVYPRGDTEVQAHARHKWAHPDMEYAIPIGVQGGAWPFKYELVSGPSGAKIGSLYGEENYGSITWVPAASSGTVEFKVRITDQELKTVEASWKVTIDPSMFIFVKSGASGTKVGTINNPLASFADWYKDPKDASYLNKIIVFRGGNYSLVGDPTSNNNLRLLKESKTPSLIGFPGEEPIFDASTTKVMVSDLSDIFIAGITWKNARQDVSNAHFLWLTGDVSRATFWRNHFRDMKQGLVGNDNTGPVFISSTPIAKENILYKENNHTGIHNKGFNGHYFDVYRASYVLIEQNTVSNSSSGNGFWPKGTVAFVTVRANNAYDNVSGIQIAIGYGTEAIDTPHDHEICWNRVVVPVDQDGPAIMVAGSNSNQGKTYNTYLYRNTIVNGYSVVRFAGAEPYETDANIIVSKNLKTWDLANMKTTIANVLALPTNGVVSINDAKFIGNDFGKVGADVATSPAPVPPLQPKYQ